MTANNLSGRATILFPVKHLAPFLGLLVACTPPVRAELTLPAIISDHMVLQQKQANSIWGWDTPGTKVTVTFAGQTRTAMVGTDVGFRFGRTLHQILGVPVGLIDNSCGGSAAEAWIRREALERDARFRPLTDATVAREAEFQLPDAANEHAAAMEKWKLASEQAKGEKKIAPVQPPAPAAWLSGNRCPGNMFGAMLHPTLGYGLNGEIGYRGETNATRAQEYAELFLFLIEQWRREWGQGDMPSYWVQLAGFRAEQAEPGESDWAELREAQTKALRLPNTGQAVIIDLGEGNDIHPGNKHGVAMRLVRWALAKDYGMDLRHRSPEFKAMAIAGHKVTITFDCFGGALRALDVAEPRGFAVCGADKVWHWATGEVTGADQVEVWSDKVDAPIAVRYAWADNPVCNLFTNEGLPVTPFRTDNFEIVTMPKPVSAAHRTR